VGSVGEGVVHTSRGDFLGARTVCACGHNLDRLFPGIAEDYGLQRCLLHMFEVATPGNARHALGCKVNLQIADSYVAEILAMKNGKLDMGEFGPVGFVFASQQAGAISLASFADSNSQLSTYTAGIWVKKGQPDHEPQDTRRPHPRTVLDRFHLLLALLGSRTTSKNVVVYQLSRTLMSFLRAVPSFVWGSST
jgi:hypothetical protein